MTKLNTLKYPQHRLVIRSNDFSSANLDALNSILTLTRLIGLLSNVFACTLEKKPFRVSFVAHQWLAFATFGDHSSDLWMTVLLQWQTFVLSTKSGTLRRHCLLLQVVEQVKVRCLGTIRSRSGIISPRWRLMNVCCWSASIAERVWEPHIRWVSSLLSYCLKWLICLAGLHRSFCCCWRPTAMEQWSPYSVIGLVSESNWLFTSLWLAKYKIAIDYTRCKQELTMVSDRMPPEKKNCSPKPIFFSSQKSSSTLRLHVSGRSRSARPHAVAIGNWAVNGEQLSRFTSLDEKTEFGRVCTAYHTMLLRHITRAALQQAPAFPVMKPLTKQERSNVRHAKTSCHFHA